MGIEGDPVDDGCDQTWVGEHGYLAKVLAAEVDDRTERRRTRRINDA